MCNCEDVEFGSYANQIKADAPPHMPKENGYRIDKCIYDEIMQLWALGITTTGCCCGHNKLDGYIGVADEDIGVMISLGYEVAHNPCRPNARDSFKPASA